MGDGFLGNLHRGSEYRVASNLIPRGVPLKRLLIAVALALVAGACSGGADIAATVNGVDIEAATVEGLLDNDGEELTEPQFRSILTALVQWNAISDAARDESVHL